MLSIKCNDWKCKGNLFYSLIKIFFYYYCSPLAHLSRINFYVYHTRQNSEIIHDETHVNKAINKSVAATKQYKM